MDCLFCKIARKELPAEVVFEDDQVVAFKDIHPKAPHHIVIIPRAHFATLNDVPAEDSPILGELLLTAQRLAKKLGVAEDGYRCLMNVNAGAGQTVFHIHLHLLAGRAFSWPPG